MCLYVKGVQVSLSPRRNALSSLDSSIPTGPFGATGSSNRIFNFRFLSVENYYFLTRLAREFLGKVFETQDR